MLSTLFSFLGGAAFRMIWGEISAYLTKRQDQKMEIERMRLQGELDAAQHARNMEAIKIQADLKVQVIRTQAEGAVTTAEADAWRQAVADIGKQTGIWFVDAWNGTIRPMLATICVFLWVRHLGEAGWKLDQNSWDLIAATLGLYVADRSLFKRGK